jgi:putative ABC transport system substrate-binding protein
MRDFLIERRRLLHRISAAVATIVVPGASRAQERRGLAIFHWDDYAKVHPGLFRALAQRGWRENENLALVWHPARADSPVLERIAADVVATAPHAILTEGTSLTRPLAKATRTVPIVTSVGDPVGSGFAASLGRPGKNVTGLCNRSERAETKCLELLKALMPRSSRVMVFHYSAIPTSRQFAQYFATAAPALGLDARLYAVASAKEAESALREGLRTGARGAVVVGYIDDDIQEWLIDALPRNGVAAVAAGGSNDRFLLSYEEIHSNIHASVAAVLDKVFRGTKPGEIAFEQPDAANIVVNRKVATSMNVEIPKDLLLRATKVVG